MKKTKIVATISDKRCEVEFLEKLYRAGMNVVRLNTAHQDMEQALKVVENVRKVSDNIAILIDTKGPEVRTMLMDEPMHVDRGETVYLTGDPELKMDGKLIHVSYPYFAEDIKVGDKVLVDDGDVEWQYRLFWMPGEVKSRLLPRLRIRREWIILTRFWIMLTG